MNKRRFIKIDYDKKRYLIHTALNVAKELSIRLNSRKTGLWIFFASISYFYSFYLSMIFVILPVTIMIFYLISELIRSSKIFNFTLGLDSSQYGLFYDMDSCQIYNGSEYGDKIRYNEIWIVFENRFTNSLTLFLKKDNSFINVFRTNFNGVNYDEFKKITKQNIRYLS